MEWFATPDSLALPWPGDYAIAHKHDGVVVKYHVERSGTVVLRDGSPFGTELQDVERELALLNIHTAYALSSGLPDIV